MARVLSRLVRVTTGKIRASRAEIGYEDRIPDEGRITDDESHVGGRVSRNMEGNAFELAEGERLAVLEKVVELRSVTFEFRTCVEELAEHFLDADDIFADSQLASDTLLQIRGDRNVIGMSMRVDQPFHLQIFCICVFDNQIGGPR